MFYWTFTEHSAGSTVHYKWLADWFTTVTWILVASLLNATVVTQTLQRQPDKHSLFLRGDSLHQDSTAALRTQWPCLSASLYTSNIDHSDTRLSQAVRESFQNKPRVPQSTAGGVNCPSAFDCTLAMSNTHSCQPLPSTYTHPPPPIHPPPTSAAPPTSTSLWLPGQVSD